MHRLTRHPIRRHAAFSRQEIADLAKSMLAIGLAYTFLQMGLSFSSAFLVVFCISLLTIGAGFLLHELAHKFVARRFGCWAEFRSDDRMLLVAVLFSFAGFLFVAPGAVIILGQVTRRDYGLISAAGPLTNGILALGFIVLGILGAGMLPGSLSLIPTIGARINSWLALFNMIPFGNFDGAKILRWNVPVYIGLVVFFGVLVFLV
ncbi:hypothetical protein COY95_04275 [Candidatus Woesearchaeota archaeon CG_4_10_14_0_8_um_filter_47_5]|nr:MAG: hypothetical protein COY95_04275 [Candidatus Woesearchaeota archaeon CG_4_10_14_0_8_um_filter_47_5]